VPVVVLDTRPDLTRARRQAARFGGGNAQLTEVVDLLSRSALPDWQSAAIDAGDTEGVKLARAPDGRQRGHDVSEHALFISGLIHDLAPRVDLRLRPVLNRFGVGDLHLLLQVLHDALAGKPVEAPLVINMSLGFVPKLEQLPWLWYGVAPANDPDFVADVSIRGQPRDQNWLIRNRPEADTTTHLLHGGLDRLAQYLLANNCLGVAAAGNDSLSRVQAGRPRLGPRIPARYESILGVAATVVDPSSAAAYSNAGDELEFGDHVATFGGDVSAGGEPKDGVVGVYAAPTFPSASGVRNESGWATWSGTSFATAIASGLVSGFWTIQRTRQPDMTAEDVLAEFNKLAGSYAPAVRTPSIAVTGDWENA
jgi:hypothetical protein